MTLASLLSSDVQVRLEALEALTLDVPGAAYAAREVLLFDEDAHVRAAAASFIERSRATAVASALVDALYDTHPSVRMAAIRALGKLGLRAGIPTLRRLALEEPIWWARRAAVLAVARLERHDAVPLLREVLDDPFWRVRHAAVRVLVALGEARDFDVHSLTTASERAESALRYIERRLGRRATMTEGAAPAPPPEAPTGLVADHDPAVIAARLEQGRAATPAELVLYLGDPHESLRFAAAKRLRRSSRRASGGGAAHDVRPLLAASWWLEEPRIPHATATVVRLLDSLGPEVEELIDALLADVDARPGAAAWALSFIEHGQRWERLAEVVRALRVDAPIVRRMATSVLATFVCSHGVPEEERERALELLRAALEDRDEDVRRLAVRGLVYAPDASCRSRACVVALPFAAQPTLVRRLIAIAAREMGDMSTLRVASRDGDPETRASSLRALHRSGALDSSDRAEAQTSEDPWMRVAVLDSASALDVLRDDVDVVARRAAFEYASRAGLAIEAARIAQTDEDAWLRTHAAERLARSTVDEDLAAVLRLSRDPDVAVRSAAADVLASRDLPTRLARVRAQAEATHDEVVRDAADTWLGVRAPRLMAEELAAPTRVTPTSESARSKALSSARAASAIEHARPLGRSGLDVSPLVLSGAHEPSVTSLFRAMNEGCNAFFWEPRHRNLTTFLRAALERGQRPLVVSGTYHASERAIRADVERTLRRLRRDHLDVFLLFWTRSAARLEEPVRGTLEALKREGLIRAAGFSTHDRALAEATIGQRPWDVVMVRHSAAHPGAEERLFQRAEEHGVGVLGFSATSYGRLLRRREGSPETLPTAAECYRYTLSQAGVSACLSAPRGGRELIENLEVLRRPRLDGHRLAALRTQGRLVREESLDFAHHIRRFPALPDAPDVSDSLDALDVSDSLDAPDALDAPDSHHVSDSLDASDSFDAHAPSADPADVALATEPGLS